MIPRPPSPPGAYLSAIAHAVGDSRPLGELEELRNDPASLAWLLDNGLENYRCAGDTPQGLAGKCLAETLRRSGLAPGNIDALVYASSSLWDADFFTKGFGEVASRLGLAKVVPIGIFLSECGNVASALRVASDLVNSGDGRNVLVVTTDVCRPGDKRLVPPRSSIFSDGAASCLVSSERRTGFEILGMEQATNQDLWKLDPETAFADRFWLSSKGISSLSKRLFGKLALQPENFDHLITNNYSLPAVKSFSIQTGIPSSRIFIRGIPEFAHVYSADILINLDLLARSETRTNGRILAVSTGYSTWGALALAGTGPV